MSIVVPATSGHLGRLVVHDLLTRGVPAADIIAGSRNLDTIGDLAEHGVRTTVIDYDDPATVSAALTGGDTFVLISGNDLPRRRQQHADAITAASQAGVAHLIYTSGLGAAGSPSPIAASHAATEVDVRASGLPYTILRNGWYTENYERSVPSVRDTGILLASVGDGRVASATRADFAAAVAAVATAPGHVGATYELSGDIAWNYDDLAAALAEVLDRDVTHQAVTPEQHLDILRGAGVPEELAGMAVMVDAGIRDGAFALTTGDLSRLIGRPTTPLVDGLRPLV